MSKRWAVLGWCGGFLALSLILGLSAWAQHGGHSMPMTPPAPPERGKPIRTTMEELHKTGGVPPGWKFTLPAGDPVKGRQVFVDLECFSCHQVKGEAFPPGRTGGPGPELTGMGSQHPAEYFAESILNPNAVIIEGPGFTGPDGLSKMPDYNDTLTVRQLLDLVAYLKSLMARGDHGTGAEPHR